MCGIYMIRNTINEKVYIGQAKDIYHRWSTHRTELNADRHANIHLQGAWKLYKPESFEFSVLEECSEDELNEKEQYYIDLYDAYEHGYNMDRGGQGILGFKHTEEQISKMRKIQNPLVVLQFDLNFNLINRFEGGPSHIRKVLGYTKECVERCCKHVGKKISYKDSYWVYEQEYLCSSFSWDKYLNQISCCEVKKDKKANSQKRICQYDKQRNLIKIWESFSDIEKAGYTRNQVNTICNQRKGKKTHKGFIWAYERYDFSNGYFDNLDDSYTESIENRKKTVKQIDKLGKCIAIYKSRTDAANSVNVPSSCITRAINAHKICCGYFWVNEDDDWFLDELDSLEEKYNKWLNSLPKTTYKLDENKNIIFIYKSRADAAKDVGTSAGDIVRAIQNQSICKGFYWAEDNKS